MKYCKRFLVLFLILALAVSAIACSEEGDPSDTTTASTTASSESTSSSTSDSSQGEGSSSSEPASSSSSEPASSSSSGGTEPQPPASPMTFTLLPGGSAYELTKYTGTDAQVTIPATWEGYPVTYIGQRAFEGCTGVTAITIPDSVFQIEMHAFKGCTGLTTITLPKNVRGMGERILEGCTGLTQIVFDAANYPDQNATNESLLGIGAQNLALVIGPNVERVGAFAFYNCEFKTITFAQNSVCTAVATSAFKGCKSVATLSIPDSVTSIGEGALNGCSALTAIDLPFMGESRTVVTTGAANALFGYVFGTAQAQGCKRVDQRYGEARADVKAYYIPASLANVTIRGGGIGYNAFAGCDMVTNLTVGDGVTAIVDYSLDETSWFVENTDALIYAGKFLYANGEAAQTMTTVTVRDGTVGICGGAFANMTELQTISLPASVTSISIEAFPACYGLTTIDVDDNNPAYQDIDGILFDKEGTKLVCYPGGRTDTGYEIPEGVRTLESMAFSFNGSLTSVTIPSSVMVVRTGAFYNAHALEQIVAEDNDVYASIDGVLYNTVTNELVAFPSAYATKHFTIPSDVTSIARQAFNHTQTLKTVTIGSQVNTIAENAFEGCGTVVIYTPRIVAIEGWADHWTDAVVYYHAIAGETLLTVDDMQILVSEKKGGGYSAEITLYMGDATSVILPASVQYTPNDGTPITVPIEKIGKYVFAFSSVENFDFTQNPQLKDFGTDAFLDSAFWLAQPEGVVYLNNMAIGYKGDLPENGIVEIATGITAICYKAFYDNSDEIKGVILSESVTYIAGNTFHSDAELTIYTYHTPLSFAQIKVAEENEAYNAATISYYSETEPTTAGCFWHLVAGVPTIWATK